MQNFIIFVKLFVNGFLNLINKKYKEKIVKVILNLST